jgi:hypothetical protein
MSFLNIPYFCLIFFEFLMYFCSRGVFSPLLPKQCQESTPERGDSLWEIRYHLKSPHGLVSKGIFLFAAKLVLRVRLIYLFA